MPVSTRNRLTQKQADLRTEARNILAAAEREEREFSDADRTRLDAIEADLETVGRDLEREERASAALIAANPAPARGVVERIHDRAEDKPWGYDLGVRMIAQGDGTHMFGGVRDAASLAVGDYLQAVARAGSPGGSADPRLIRAAASGGNTSNPEDGGFLVQTDMLMFLFDRGMEASQLASLCNNIIVSENADSIEAPYVSETSRATGSRWGGVQVYRRSEADTVAATKPTLEMFDLRLADLMGLAYTTGRQLADARALGQVYTKAFSSEFGFKLDDEIIRGSGIGECQGVLTSPALISVAKESGQLGDSIVYNNLSKMWVRLHGRSRGNAIWFYNQEAEPQFDVMTIPVGTAGMEPRFVSYGPDGVLRIKGRPARTIEQCSALGDVGDLLLLDLSEYVLIRKGGIEFAESMHVRFVYGEQTFRWMQRINGKSPWRSAITPYKGTATQSPFVALAERA